MVEPSEDNVAWSGLCAAAFPHVPHNSESADSISTCATFPDFCLLLCDHTRDKEEVVTTFNKLCLHQGGPMFSSLGQRIFSPSRGGSKSR